MTKAEELIETYQLAVSQRVAFNSQEHREAELAARQALLEAMVRDDFSHWLSTHTVEPDK